MSGVICGKRGRYGITRPSQQFVNYGRCTACTPMQRIVNALEKLNQAKRRCGILALCATSAIALPAHGYTTRAPLRLQALI